MAMAMAMAIEKAASPPAIHSAVPSHKKSNKNTNTSIIVSFSRNPSSSSFTTRRLSFRRASATRRHSHGVVTKDSWAKSILETDMPVLVEFYASWCGPCRMVHRIIDEISREYAGKLDCFVLNTDNDLEVAEDYEIKAVPVVVLFKNGEKRESIIGTMPKEFYMAAIERVLSS